MEERRKQPRDNVEGHHEIMFSLGNLIGKVDGINQRLDSLNGRIGVNTGRIHSIESWKDNLIGKITVIVAIFGIIISAAFVIINLYFG